MNGFDLHTPALTVTIALAMGMIAQSLAFHLRLPGIVILLLCGVLLGPDGLGIIDPAVLGPGLPILVGFAIAVILFEGGLLLEWSRLRREAATIRRLVTVGGLITWAGAACAAHFILKWDWRHAILFGSLVIVTGPTVVGPLLRRIRVNHNLQTILEAEGVFIDAIGVVLATVALEVAMHFGSESLTQGAAQVGQSLLTGTLVGVVAGGIMMLLLRWRRLIPAGMEKVFTLTVAWAAFQAGNALSPESGILAAIVAGLVIGNARRSAVRDLKEFKEQLTVMLIGMLFILLAASVRMSEVTGLGWRGVAVVAVLSVVVRPLEIALCTAGSGLSWREKAFLAWIAPRGIVAAALATLFHERLVASGDTGGESIRGLVFLVIACTVVVQGLTGSLVANLLGVRRPRGRGYVIVGANELAQVVGEALRKTTDEIVFIDTNPELCTLARKRGFTVIMGNALDDRAIMQAELDTRRALLALLPNGGVNLLFARRALEVSRGTPVYVTLHRAAIKNEHVADTGGRVLFGADVDVGYWAGRLSNGEAGVESWRFDGVPKGSNIAAMPGRELKMAMMPIVATRGTAAVLVDENFEPRKGDVVSWVTLARRAEEARNFLATHGWADAGNA